MAQDRHVVWVGLAALALYARTLTYPALAWDDPVWLGDPIHGASWPDAVGLAFGALHDRTWSPLLRL
ncbi:MAG TPA: hypothetical protein PKA64_11905, partial [Myxococcota bacterium]|nr:hypothetical protein [Myxococcota bacterium]